MNENQHYVELCLLEHKQTWQIVIEYCYFQGGSNLLHAIESTYIAENKRILVDRKPRRIHINDKSIKVA
jgi:hypothetical protein